jgi:nucleoside-diphosphate-sugar epimerase
MMGVSQTNAINVFGHCVFSRLFNDIFIDRLDSSNNNVTTMKVPISYGPKEKFLARLNNDPTLTRPFAMVLPRISFQINSIVYDATKPDGTPRKLMDVTKLSGLGWKYTISLKKGLEMVYQEYQSRQ